MKASWILATAAIVSAHLAIESPVGAAPMGVRPEFRPAPDVMLAQGADPADDVKARVTRLWHNRSILENALRPPRQAAPTPPPLPQARALQAPAPETLNAPPEPAPQPEPEMTAEAQPAMSCDAAAAVVADYGFSDVLEEDCSSDLYRFSAMRDGTAYSIAITAATGEIAEVSRD